ncbi:MAG: hypothetical protein CMK59_10960 [Proteobacteria bacterium]|nr:hypothetical protein [Pseudomonadota bacterium]
MRWPTGLGFGDVVGLMNDFERVADKKEAEKDAMKMLEGNFNFEDFLKQIKMIQKMGSFRSIIDRLPGMGDLMSQIPPEALDDKELRKVESMIQSMTRQERRFPNVLNSSRMNRIAKGSGHSLDEVKSLYERFEQTRSMMGQLGQSGMMQSMMQGKMPNLGGLGGFPGMGAPKKSKGSKAERRLARSKQLAESKKKLQQQKRSRKKNRRK